MGNYEGSRHTLGFKPQASAGSLEATVTTFLSTESFSMNANPKHIARKTFAGTGRNLPSRAGWIEPGGKTTCELMASQPQPLYWALGNVVTTQPSGVSDPTVYLHTITATTGDPVRLTAEGDRVFDKAKQGDLFVNKLTGKAQVGEVATLGLEWLALSHTDGATCTSTPAFVTDVLTCRTATITMAGSPNLTVPEIEFEWDNALEQLPVLTSTATSGAPNTIRRKEAPKGTGKIKFIDYPTAELAKLIAATSFSLVVLLEGDTISNSYKKFVRVTLPACQYTGGLDPEIGSEVITGDANFEFFYDTVSSRQILVEAQNTISAINT